MDRQLAQARQNPATSAAPGSVSSLERVLCFQETDGQLLWTHEYECPYSASYAAGPRVTPLVRDGKVYTLGTEGNLCCLEARTGKPIWSRDLKRDYGIATPVWGFAGHPLLDGQKLFCLVGGDGTTAVAFDKDTGKEVWRALRAKEPGYCPPTLIEAAGRRLLIIWHPESVNALNPDTGQLYWSAPFSARTGLSIATPRLLGDLLYLSAFYDGSLMLRLKAGDPEVVWRCQKPSEQNTDCLHSLMVSPFLEDGHIYGVCSYGHLRCLKADTGERVWATLAATTPEKETRWGTAFLVKNGRRFFLFNEKGDLIIARLSPRGYEEISRARLLDPVNKDPGRLVVWSHPAFANRSCYARNDKEMVCVSLAAAPAGP
jgi:outer membrane protein assembly factor BamB